MAQIALTAAILVAAALAGCVAGDDEGTTTTSPTDDPHESQGDTTTGNTTGNATQSNTTTATSTSSSSPPVWSPADGLVLEVEPLNGTVPANVTLRYDVPDDREGLAWSLTLWRNATLGNGTAAGSNGNATVGTVDGNATRGNATEEGDLALVLHGTGADLPGLTVQHINATGVYTVHFEVGFPNGTTGLRNATFTLREIQPGDFLGNETREFSGSFLASEPLLCTASAEYDWPLNGTFAGHAANVSLVNATVAASGFADDYELILVAPNGTELASGPSLNVSGPFEPGNYTLRVESCVAADPEYTVTATASYVAALAQGQA